MDEDKDEVGLGSGGNSGSRCPRMEGHARIDSMIIHNSKINVPMPTAASAQLPCAIHDLSDPSAAKKT